MKNLFELNGIETLGSTEQINKMFRKAIAMQDLSEYLVTIPFFMKKAIKLMEKSNRLKSDAWNFVNAIYPDSNTTKYSYIVRLAVYKLEDPVLVKTDDLNRLDKLIDQDLAVLK